MPRLVSWWICSVIVMIGTVTTGQPVVARTLVVALNNAPPYRIIKDTASGMSYSGIYIDVVREAASRAGIDLEFEVVPFKRALHLIEKGKADLMLGPNRTDERQKYMYYFGAALPNEPKAVYLGASDADVVSITDLGQKSVGVLRGANYGWQLEDAKDVRLVEAVDYAALFRMLDLGRIDALIVPELQGVEQIRQGGPFNIRKASLVLQGQPSFIGLSRLSDYYIDGSFTELEQVLVKMRQDGTFDAIYDHYAQPVD